MPTRSSATGGSTPWLTVSSSVRASPCLAIRDGVVSGRGTPRQPSSRRVASDPVDERAYLGARSPSKGPHGLRRRLQGHLSRSRHRRSSPVARCARSMARRSPTSSSRRCRRGVVARRSPEGVGARRPRRGPRRAHRHLRGGRRRRARGARRHRRAGAVQLVAALQEPPGEAEVRRRLRVRRGRPQPGVPAAQRLDCRPPRSRCTPRPATS